MKFSGTLYLATRQSTRGGIASIAGQIRGGIASIAGQILMCTCMVDIRESGQIQWFCSCLVRLF